MDILKPVIQEIVSWEQMYWKIEEQSIETDTRQYSQCIIKLILQSCHIQLVKIYNGIQPKDVVLKKKIYKRYKDYMLKMCILFTN